MSDEELRIDRADGEAYRLSEFIEEYGGSAENPPQEWLDAAPAQPAAAPAAAADGEQSADLSPRQDSSDTVAATPSSAQRPTRAEGRAIEAAAINVAARLRQAESFDEAVSAAEAELRADGGGGGEWEKADHPFHHFYRWRVSESAANGPRQQHPSASDDGSVISSQPLRQRPRQANGTSEAASGEVSPAAEEFNPLAILPSAGRRGEDAQITALDRGGVTDPFGASERLSHEALQELKKEREREYRAMEAAREAMELLQTGALPLTAAEAAAAEERYAARDPTRRRRLPARVAQARDDWRQRRWARMRQAIIERHGERAGGAAQLILCSVRLQCWWRGVRVRLLQSRLRRKGMQLSSHDRRCYEVVAGTFQIQSDVKWDLPTSIRHLECGPYGAWKSFRGDISSTRISWRKVLYFYAIRGGHKRTGCGGCGLVLLFLWLSALIAVIFLLPGFCVLGLKIFFLEGHNSLTIDQIMAYVLFFIGLMAIGVIVLYVALDVEQERFAWRLDLVFSIVAAKHKALLTLKQQQDLRGTDLFTTKRAFYWDVPVCYAYGMLAFLSLVTVFVLEELLGWINLGYGLVVLTVMAMYDRLVLTQAKIMRAVVQHEGAEYRRSLRVAENPVPGAEAAAGDAALQPPRYRDRDYKIAIMKALSRMSRTFARLHAAVAATVIMATVSGAIFFWYAGCRRMEDSKPRLLPHSFVLCLVYSLMTQWGTWMLCRHLSALFLARPAVERVFRMGWHFRETTEDSVFVEKHCQMVAKSGKLKASREQPPSRELGFICITVWVFVLLWVLIFAGQGVQIECAPRAVDCVQVNDVTGEQRAVGKYNMVYTFNVYEGCSPVNPIATTLKGCGETILRDALKTTTDAKWRLEDNSTYIVQAWYTTWRGTRRGLEKKMRVRRGVQYYSVCPESNLLLHPFKNIDELNDTLVSPLAVGDIGSTKYRSVPEVFYDQRAKIGGLSMPFYGCFPEHAVPDGVCPSGNAVRQCWCDQGQPRPLRNTAPWPCSCTTNAISYVTPPDGVVCVD